MNACKDCWKTLCLLTWHEGNILVSRARMRLKGYVCDDTEHALHMAALVVTDDDVDGVTLSPYNREVLNAINSIDREIR